MNSWEIRNSCCLLGCPFCWLRMRMPQLLTPPFNHWLGDGLPTYGLIESEVIETTMRKGSKDEYIPRNAGEIVGNYRANQANGYTKTWTVHTEHDEFIGWLPGFSRLTKQLPASNAFMCFPNSYNFWWWNHAPYMFLLNYSVCVTKTGFSNKKCCFSTIFALQAAAAMVAHGPRARTFALSGSAPRILQ